MNYFRIFIDNKSRTTIQALDAYDACWKIHRETGIAMGRISAVSTISPDAEKYF